VINNLPNITERLFPIKHLPNWKTLFDLFTFKIYHHYYYHNQFFFHLKKSVGAFSSFCKFVGIGRERVGNGQLIMKRRISFMVLNLAQ